MKEGMRVEGTRIANPRGEAGRLRYKNEHGTRLTEEWSGLSNA
jgi:hypothetical protein